MTLLIIISLFSISSVCASDLNNDTTGLNDVLSDQSAADAVLTSDDSYSSFFQLNTSISDADSSLKLTENFAFNQTSDGNFSDGIKVVKDDLVIDGDNHIVDADGKVRIFNITGNNVTLMNIVFINALADDGGALYITGNNSKIINCTFVNNSANNECGGAIFWASSDNGTVANSTFINNTAVSSGGALFWCECDKGIITQCIFINNRADSSGGAIFSKGRSKIISNSTFSNNSADSYGGAIYSQDGINIVKSSFVANEAVDYGGAVYFATEFDNCILSKSNFTDNYAEMGSCIYILESCSAGIFVQLNFINNSGEYGVGIYSMAEVYNTLFYKLNFINNKAKDSAGAIFFRNKLQESNFSEINMINNSAKVGGALSFNGQVLYNTFTQINASDNYASMNGGAIQFTNPVDGNLFNKITFNNNSALNKGGVIYSHLLVAHNNFTDVDFENNRAGQYAGVMFIQSDLGDNLFENCTFVKNEAVNGSVLYAGSQTLLNTFANTNFTSNVAGDTGIFYFAYTSQDEFINSRFSNNDLNNAILYFADDSNVYIANCEFKDNTAGNVSDIYCNGEAYGDISDSIFNDKNSIFVSGGSLISLNNNTQTCKFDDSYFVLNYGDINLKGNSLTNVIINNGNIRSNVSVVILNNTTRSVSTSPVELSAYCIDDNGNYIAANSITFDVGGDKLTVPMGYNGIVTTGYKLTSPGTYLVNATLSGNFSNCVYRTGTVIFKISNRILNNKNVKVYYDSNKKYSVKLIGDDGNAEIMGKSVTVLIDGKKYTYKTDKNGFISIVLDKNFKVGSHKIKIQYKGDSVQNKITVKHTLKSKKAVTFKKSAKKVVLKAKISKKVKNKIIKFKIKGKTYKVKTNRNGIAKLVIKNKFKKGKYSVKITYLKDKIKTKLKIK